MYSPADSGAADVLFAIAELKIVNSQTDDQHHLDANSDAEEEDEPWVDVEGWPVRTLVSGVALCVRAPFALLPWALMAVEW